MIFLDMTPKAQTKENHLVELHQTFLIAEETINQCKSNQWKKYLQDLYQVKGEHPKYINSYNSITTTNPTKNGKTK